MLHQSGHQPSKIGGSWLGPVRIALVYLLFSVLWIFFSDRFLVVIGVENMHLWQTLKGWGFVTATALLIYLLTRSAYRKKYDALTALNNELEERVKIEVTKQRQSEQLLLERSSFM